MTPEDIKAEIDLELVSTSTPKGETDLEKSTATNLMNMVMQQLPLLQQMGVEINLIEMFKWIFRKHGAEKEAGRFFPGLSEQPGPQLPDPTRQEESPAGQPPLAGPEPQIDDAQMEAQQQAVQPQSIAQGPAGALGGQF